MSAPPLLRVRDLCVAYGHPARGGVEAVHGLSFDLEPGEIVGLVGESGSGKSTALMAMLRVLPPPGLITGGRVLHRGRDVLAMSEEELRAWRWSEVSLVPQSALNALNPMLTVGQHFGDTLRAHGVGDRAERGRRATELLRLVDIDPTHLDSHPHTLSGGMRQRVALALALALDPGLVVLDEPTTALDVVVEREILQRVVHLQRERGFAVLFITHDLSLLLELADRVGVLYSGRLAELAPVEVLRQGGRHPYTQGLLAAMPQAFSDRQPVSIPGAPPRLGDPPPGCRFHPRCPHAEARCKQEEPRTRPLDRGQGTAHLVACHLAESLPPAVIA